jgi:hypothetical protein
MAGTLSGRAGPRVLTLTVLVPRRLEPGETAEDLATPHPFQSTDASLSGFFTG